MATFKQLCTSIKKSGEALRQNIQKALVMAQAHFAEHGDTTYFTQLMDASKESRAIRTKTLQGFIQAHANVSYSKDKNGNFVFKKVGKEVSITEMDTPWWTFDKKGEATPEMDAVSQAKALYTRISKALNGESDKKLKDEDNARAVMEALKAFAA